MNPNRIWRCAVQVPDTQQVVGLPANLPANLKDGWHTCNLARRQLGQASILTRLDAPIAGRQNTRGKQAKKQAADKQTSTSERRTQAMIRRKAGNPNNGHHSKPSTAHKRTNERTNERTHERTSSSSSSFVRSMLRKTARRPTDHTEIDRSSLVGTMSDWSGSGSGSRSHRAAQHNTTPRNATQRKAAQQRSDH